MWQDERKIDLFVSDGICRVFRHDGMMYKEKYFALTVKHSERNAII